jgi:hypothetical protein
MMSPHSESLGHLERSAGNDRLRRALAARLDRALKRAGISSALAANWLGVSDLRWNIGEAELLCRR